MERERSTKIIAFVALIFGVVGLSVGFAAFSNTLTISSNVDVKPDSSKFDVNFSSSDKSEVDGKLSATVSVDTITGADATIDNTGNPTIKGLKANFTEPGQTVTYSFYAHNAGEYIGYLKSVTFANVADENDSKVCTGSTGTTQSLVDEACKGISISVKVGTETYTGSNSNITNHSLAIDSYEPIVVTISYDADSVVADGDFSVKFGDISLLYSSVD